VIVQPPVGTEPISRGALAFHQLTFLPEGDEVTVGRTETDSYCVLPADGAELLQRLVRGMAPAQAAAWYATEYGEPVDVEEFLEAMDELGFIRKSGVETSTGPIRWQRFGAALFARPAWAAYAFLVASAGLVMLRHHDLLPRTGNMYFCSYATPVLLLAVFGQFPLVLLHEAFHALAGRRLGVNSRLRISRRLNILVAETALDGLVVVPRRKRYLPILAGMLADLLVIAALTLVAEACRRDGGGEPMAGRICLALAYLTLLRFLWQFYFFLRTDLYQLIVTSLGCVDLHRTASQLIANRVVRLLRWGRPRYDETSWHPRDRSAARWYSWVLVSGYAISLGTFVIAIVPLLFHLFRNVLRQFSQSRSVSLDSLADAWLFLLLTVAQLVAVGYLMLRERRQRHRAAVAHVIG